MTRTTLLLSAGDVWPLTLATMLTELEDVTVVLLDRGADLSRPAHPAATVLQSVIDTGTPVLVDVDALRRRGIPTTSITANIKPTDLASVADLLIDATDKAVWL